MPSDVENFNIVAELASRIADPFPKTVSCDEGWHGLLYDLHQKLVSIDPHYTIIQVKEKFGTLRFYFESSSRDLNALCHRIVGTYEQMSGRICERTGEPGILLVKNGYYKTLNERFLAEGWEKAPVSVKGISSIRGTNER